MQSGKRRRFVNFARIVALLSVILGSLALIISLSVLEGFDSMLKDTAIKFTSHISIRSYNSRNIYSYYIREKLPLIKEIKDYSFVIEREGLVRTKSFIEGVMIRSFDPQHDLTNLKNNIIEGTFNFSEKSAKDVIIGKGLARKLKVKSGDSVVLFAMKKEFSASGAIPELEKFRVSGIYETGMSQYDDIYLYIPYQTATDFLSMPSNQASSVDVMLYDVQTAPAVSGKIQNLLEYPYYCYTVFDLHRPIFTWIEYQKEPIPLVLGLISIVAVLNIITILLITVVEKTRSIGILRALGMTRKQILSLFVFQGTSIGLLGTLIGCGLGLTLCWLQLHFSLIKLDGSIYFLDTLPVKISVWHYVIVIGCSLLLSFLATLIPASIATKISPIRAIRFK